MTVHSIGCTGVKRKKKEKENNACVVSFTSHMHVHTHPFIHTYQQLLRWMELGTCMTLFFFIYCTGSWGQDEHLEVWLIPVHPYTVGDEQSFQKHFLKTIWGPNSSYSSWLIQAELKAGRLASTAPPVHTEKSRSFGLVTRTHSARSGGTIFRSSLWSRSGRPASRVLPPFPTTQKGESREIFSSFFFFKHCSQNK